MTSADAFPKERENVDAQQCEHCQFSADYAGLAFGHTKCAVHRPCTGTKYWEPDNCPHCLEMVNKFKATGGAARRTQLKEMRTFLTEAKLKIEHKDPHKRWEFMPIYEYTFRKLNDSIAARKQSVKRGRLHKGG